MRFLIDTHVLIWWLKNADRIPRNVRDELSNGRNTVAVSAASAWEIAIKVKAGKLDFPQNFLDAFDDNLRALVFEPLNITAHHAATGAQLPGTHKDPFDRLIAGQAQADGLTLVSADPVFASLGIIAFWG